MKSSFSMLIHRAFPMLSLCMAFSCNNHPLSPFESSFTASGVQTLTVQAKTKIDFLFVIDESESMKEEQESLARNFETFADLIFQDLNGKADYRISIVSTGSIDPSSRQHPLPLGSFVKTATQETIQELNCPSNLPPVISEDNLNCPAGDLECQRTNLLKTFQCLARVGDQGFNFEKGLEAMRLALSCNGPNSGFFLECCRDLDTRDGKFYDPTCQSTPNIRFLRPDALLVVIFLTDEDDCSLQGDANQEASLAICAVPYTNRGALDGFTKRRYCPGGDSNACYVQECGNLQPEECYHQKCELPEIQEVIPEGFDPQRTRVTGRCARVADRLTPVSEYHEFLLGLKAQPADQIIVASIVGPPVTTSAGQPLNYSFSLPNDASCISDSQFVVNNIDLCCPGGQCGLSTLVNACEQVQGSGSAASGYRYLDLSTRLRGNGIGCSATGDNCVTICDNDLSGPLMNIKGRIITAVGEYCLERAPACLIEDSTLGQRTCSPEEELIPSNYAISVSTLCELGLDEGGNCGERGSTQVLSLGTDYQVIPNDATCPSGIRLRLAEPPSAGSTLNIDMIQRQNEDFNLY